tara:strand:+ start:393 stop:707 length:315 start_codon:yes stop_codon:yes gene_type:complete
MKLSLLFSILTFISTVYAEDIRTGEVIAKTCALCHGERGLSTMPETPSLAGQPRIYLAAQLRNFRDGKRQNARMSVIAGTLSDTDIDLVSEFYSKQKIELKIND